MINAWLLRYLVTLIIVFFAYFGYHMVLGKHEDALSFFYTTHLAFDGMLLGGIMLRAFVCLFEINDSHDQNVIVERTARTVRG